MELVAIELLATQLGGKAGDVVRVHPVKADDLVRRKTAKYVDAPKAAEARPETKAVKGRPSTKAG